MCGRTLRLLLLGIAVLIVLLFATGVIPWPWSPEPPPLPKLGEFVAAVHVHGVPYEVASRYHPSSVDALLDWLAKDQFKPYWSNIVLTIGMIGPTKAEHVDRLIAFLEKPAPGTPLSAIEYQARQSVLMSLAYAANKMDDDQAVGYLIGSSEPSQWVASRINWESPYGESKPVIQRHLARLGIIALGLSGRSAALARLTALRDELPADAADAAFRTANGDIIAAAIATHGRVTKDGLKAYYKKTPKVKSHK